MDFELISFKLCPFVQRAAIILHFKEIPFQTSTIDLADPPDWFRTISPLGKVPVLRLDGTTVAVPTRHGVTGQAAQFHETQGVTR